MYGEFVLTDSPAELKVSLYVEYQCILERPKLEKGCQDMKWRLGDVYLLEKCQVPGTVPPGVVPVTGEALVGEASLPGAHSRATLGKNNIELWKGLQTQRLIGSAGASFKGLDTRQDAYNKELCSPGSLVNNPVI